MPFRGTQFMQSNEYFIDSIHMQKNSDEGIHYMYLPFGGDANVSGDTKVFSARDPFWVAHMPQPHAYTLSYGIELRLRV